MPEYQKIPGPYRRHTEGPERNKLIVGAWSSPELETLADARWVWTEKVDGTNIRIIWDGHRVQFGGRTERAQLPAKLIEVLRVMFPEELLEQAFGETPVTLYGEGYGAGIQSGGAYRPDQSFILFDVLIDGMWLLRPNVEDVASKLGIDVVPVILRGPVSAAINTVTAGLKSQIGGEAEGLVGVTETGLLDRRGHRLIVKVKRADFR